MKRSKLVGGSADGGRVPDKGAFHVLANGEVYRWHAEWDRYVYDQTARKCLNCYAIVEVPVEEPCPLCGFTDGAVWEDAG